LGGPKLKDESNLKGANVVIKTIDPRTYVVVVDYSQSFKQMKAIGKFEITGDDFEGVVSEGYAINGQGVKSVPISLIRFSPFVSSECVVEEMKLHSYRPATIDELFALAAQYPDIQLVGGDIVELGTIDNRDEDDPAVAFIGEEDGKRNLWHDCWDQEWDDSVRFAAVAI